MPLAVLAGREANSRWRSNTEDRRGYEFRGTWNSQTPEWADEWSPVLVDRPGNSSNCRRCGCMCTFVIARDIDERDLVSDFLKYKSLDAAQLLRL